MTNNPRVSPYLKSSWSGAWRATSPAHPKMLMNCENAALMESRREVILGVHSRLLATSFPLWESAACWYLRDKRVVLNYLAGLILR